MNEKVKISVVDTFNGRFYKAYDILELNIPLKAVGKRK